MVRRRGILRHVLVRIFPVSQRAAAYGTHYVLIETGVTTATIAKTKHVDGAWFYYVFADRDEMLSKSATAFPGLGFRPRVPGLILAAARLSRKNPPRNRVY